MPVLRGIELITFGICSALALVLFSLTDENGAEIHLDSALFTVMLLFGLSILIMAAEIEIYENNIRPLCASRPRPREMTPQPRPPLSCRRLCSPRP